MNVNVVPDVDGAGCVIVPPVDAEMTKSLANAILVPEATIVHTTLVPIITGDV